MPTELGSAYGEIIIGTGGAEQSVQSLSDKLRSVGKTISMGISAPLIGVGAAAIASASGFEQSMNVMAQVSGATGAQMDALREQALRLGAETSFSAGEAADGMLELAKAGMTASQTGDAIAGVMDLAAAGGLGLADAATITANAINAFGLQASDSAAVANTFAAAANASSADVTDLAQGFQMASAVFAANGQSVDDLAASLAILSNNGIAGSDAGTSLKTMMMRLAASTDEASQVIGELGIQVYDANGEMLPFFEIVAQLGEVTDDMSDAQRNAALQTIFGADAIRAATILAKEGSGTYEDMKDALQEQGAAAAVAGARMQGFRGAIEYIKGSIDSFLIGAALPFLDSMSGIVRQVADVISGFGNLSQPVKDAALAFAAVLAVAGPVMLAIGGIASVVGALASPIGLVVLALAGLAAAWAGDWGGIREKTAAAWATIQPMLAAAWDWFQARLPGALAALQAGFSAAWTAVSSSVSTAWAAIQPYLAQAVTWLQANLPGALTTLQSGFSSTWTAIASSVSTAWAALQSTWTTIQTWLQTNLPTAVSGLQTAWATAWPAISSAVATAWTGMQTSFSTIQTWLTTNLPTAATTLQTGFTSVWEALPGVVSTAQTTMTTAFAAIQTAWQTLAGFFGPAIERVKVSFMGLGTQVEPVKTAISGLLTAFQNLWIAVQPIITALGTVIGAVLGVAALATINAFSAALQALGPIITTVVDTMTAVLSGFALIFSGIVETIRLLIEGDFAGAWAAAGTVLQGAVDVLVGILQGLYDLAVEIFTALATTVTTTLEDLGVSMSDIVESIKSWWAEKWNAMVGFVQPAIDIIGTLQKAIENFKTWISGISFSNPWSALTDAAGAVGGALSGAAGAVGNALGGLLPGNAVGASWAGNGMALVGERGPEFIIPPAGSKVLTNGQSNRLAAQGADMGGGTVINMGPVTIANNMDIEAVAYRVATINARLRRG